MHQIQKIGILGLVVAALGGSYRAEASMETQSALNALASARRATVTRNFRAAGANLAEARRTLSFLRREPQLREAVRSIDAAEEALYRGQLGVVIHVLRSIQEAEHAILTSDAHRYVGRPGGGNGGGFGGPGRRDQVECRASDRGWEEHRGGHTAQGFNEFAVRQRALNECQRFHGRCEVTCRNVR